MKVSTEFLDMLQNRIDMIANNLANINTPGFKEQLLAVEEGFDTKDRSNEVAQYGNVMPSTGNPVLDTNLYVGKRIRSEQGALVETGNPWDMGINGEGFFQVKTTDGKIGYTRAGLFGTDSIGNLVNNEGMLMEPPVMIPENAEEISVSSDGMIKAYLRDDTDPQSAAGTGNAGKEAVEIGQISLFKFKNPDGLEQMGHNIYLPTQASGEAIVGIAGADGYGEIKSGMLERSNTDIVNAMTSLIQTQRAYQLEARRLKTQDEMLQQAEMVRG
ncbi:MAG: Flagellar basal-body rod protein FlgG [Candidatus Dichloromethanomonas elyunquensis]|nr:MAG: Flagellar basal-body rod protein FlgG [Candidatus Dichloromethanomonas elyunquensis]